MPPKAVSSANSFTPYTQMSVSAIHPSRHTILSLFNDNNSVTTYQHSIPYFTQWCTDNYLQKGGKTEELLISSSKTPHSGLNLTFIHSKTAEQVNSFKYLGLIIDNKLIDKSIHIT